jgi:ApaG protein
MYKAVTRGISVVVTPRYMPEESSPEEERYFFAYTVEIVNTGSERVQLRSRHWKIMDERGQMQEVRGAGVVGEQPILHGTYVMETDSGDRFVAEIPLFSLDIPQTGRVVH